MRHRPLQRKLDRRRFLIEVGAGLMWAATGCGRRGRVPANSVAPPAPSPTSRPAFAPSLTPPPTVTPQPAAVRTTAPVSLEEPADLALVNGKVITVSPSDAIAQAVAIKNGLIQAVGTTEEVHGTTSGVTKVVDLGGKSVTPGLIDAHNHLQIMGLMGSLYVAFIPPEVKTIPDMQSKLANLVAQAPKGQWIQGYYWSVGEGRVPNRQDLDPVSPEHPVWIMQQGGHYGAANSAALRMAGVTAATPNPAGGVIERDSRGDPTGVFYNHRAMDVLRRVIPPYTTEMVRDNITSTQPIMAACGVTSFQDNNVRGTDVLGTYLDAGKRQAMTLRGAVYFTLEWPQDLDRALKEVERYEDPYMRMAGFKFLIDGQAPTAYCHEPHNGVAWNMPTWEPQSFKQAVRALHDTGLQICVHCVGDAAVDLVLDAYEEAMNANPRPDPRHRIEHCILCTPDATKRMKDLGVVVSTQPQFLRMGGDYWPTIFGEERARRAIVTREWLDVGIRVALGSDAPTTPWHTPQITLAGAVTRITVSNRVFEKGQCLTIQEALRAHTWTAAYAAHEENIKGSIEVGKLADLTVWKEDPYSISMQRLAQAQIAMTIVGGKTVYEA
jgi:predicted amidohydrolase YtcJ